MKVTTKFNALVRVASDSNWSSRLCSSEEGRDQLSRLVALKPDNTQLYEGITPLIRFAETNVLLEDTAVRHEEQYYIRIYPGSHSWPGDLQGIYLLGSSNPSGMARNL